MYLQRTDVTCPRRKGNGVFLKAANAPPSPAASRQTLFVEPECL
jgi:hypothetical protein